jgi:Fe-S-cluster containining protein
MCGKCCKAIRLSVDWDYILRLCPQAGTEEEIKSSISIRDSLFIRSFWKPISIEEALKINPHLRTWPNAENEEIAHYYICTKFDESTNKCTIHESRARVCYGFPCLLTIITPAPQFSPDFFLS